MKNFYIHFFIYIAVSIGLLIIDLQNNQALDWAWYPIGGWGTGIFFHFIKVKSDQEKKRNEKRSKTLKKSLYTLQSMQEVELPIHYKNWEFTMATWTVPVAQIEKFLPKKLKPILFSPGKALISFGTLEYPNVSSLKPYNEFLISIPVQYKPKWNIPFLPLFWNPFFTNENIYNKGSSFIYYLPVTTEESYKAGSEIWGFPKVHRQMKLNETQTWKKCDLINGNEVEMTLEIKKHSVCKQKRSFEYGSWTEKNNTLLRTLIPAKGNYGVKVFGADAKITFKNGKIAEEMKKLTLSSKPVQTFIAQNIESDLPVANDVIQK